MKQKVVLGTSLLFLAASVSFGQDVSTDYNHKAPFSDYRTYKWLRPAQMSDPLMVERVTAAVDQQLHARGLQPSNGDQADLGVVVNGATHERHTLQTFYDGFGGWGWWGWGAPGMATTETQNYTVGTLIVDLFDSRTKQIVWRSVAKDTLSDKPEKNTAKLDKAVEKMFKDYPSKNARAMNTHRSLVRPRLFPDAVVDSPARLQGYASPGSAGEASPLCGHEDFACGDCSDGEPGAHARTQAPPDPNVVPGSGPCPAVNILLCQDFGQAAAPAC